MWIKSNKHGRKLIIKIPVQQVKSSYRLFANRWRIKPKRMLTALKKNVKKWNSSCNFSKFCKTEVLIRAENKKLRLTTSKSVRNYRQPPLTRDRISSHRALHLHFQHIRIRVEQPLTSQMTRVESTTASGNLATAKSRTPPKTIGNSSITVSPFTRLHPAQQPLRLTEGRHRNSSRKSTD